MDYFPHLGVEEKMILVTAAIIERDGKYLITQRTKDNRHGAGRWEFPGGKKEEGEDECACLEREIKEELGLTVKAGEHFLTSEHVYADTKKHVKLMGYHCTIISGEIEHHDIEDHAWVTPQEMKDYDITEADLPFVEKLINNY